MGKNMAAEGGNVWTSGRYKIGVEENRIVIMNNDKKMIAISSNTGQSFD